MENVLSGVKVGFINDSKKMQVVAGGKNAVFDYNQQALKGRQKSVKREGTGAQTLVCIPAIILYEELKRVRHLGKQM